MVRMKVAKSELTFSMPILAKIAVSAAKAADNSAQNGQESMTFFMVGEPSIDLKLFLSSPGRRAIARQDRAIQ
jgi:hypothetical protein